MNELITELNQSGIGPTVSNQILNSLLFADDIVLIADTESNLEKLLHITYKFAKKWNLKINQSKSKIMVIGKRLSDKVWKMGDLNLTETNEYKYLGIYFKRSLKSHYHINNHIKDSGSENQWYG